MCYIWIWIKLISLYPGDFIKLITIILLRNINISWGKIRYYIVWEMRRPKVALEFYFIEHLYIMEVVQIYSVDGNIVLENTCVA